MIRRIEERGPEEQQSGIEIAEILLEAKTARKRVLVTHRIDGGLETDYKSDALARTIILPQNIEGENLVDENGLKLELAMIKRVEIID